jgi:hypothetical protein
MLKYRKIWFFMRNLKKLEYHTLDSEKRVHFLASPLSFIYQIFNAASLNQAYDHYKTLALRQTVEKEFEKMKPIDQNLKDALKKAQSKDGAEKSMVDWKEGNVLEISFNDDGIDLEKFGVINAKESMKIDKLEFAVFSIEQGGKSKAIYKKVFTEKEMLSQVKVLKNKRILVENVNMSSEIKFALNIVQKQEGVTIQRTGKKDIFRPLGPSGSVFLSDYKGRMLNRVEVQGSVRLCNKRLDLNLKATQNVITKQPARVIEVTFHRFIKLDPENDMVSTGDSEKQPNNIKMLLMEETAIEKLNEIVRPQDIIPIPDDDERGGQNNGNDEIVKGSVNDMIREQSKTEQKQSSTLKYNMYIDFDTAEPFKGDYHEMSKVDINKFGKTTDKEINKFEINNTKASNKISFSIFRDGSRASERLRQFGIGVKSGECREVQEPGCIAFAEIDVCRLSGFQVNQPSAYLYPMTQFTDASIDPQCANYKVENTFVLFSVTVTDKAFGEVVMNLNEFRGLPECKTIREMQYRVTVKPSRASVTAQKMQAQLASDDPLASAGQVPRVEPIYEYQSPRIPYEIGNVSQLDVARELVVGVKMKDIFSNRRLFMSETAKEIYEEQDMRLFIDFFGFDKLHTKMLIGQWKGSIIDLIQNCFSKEAEDANKARVAKAKQERAELEAEKAEEAAGKDLVEDQQVSGKAMALEQEQAQRVQLAQKEA